MHQLLESTNKTQVHSDKPRFYSNLTHSEQTLGLRFMVTRDPFTRLVSSYLDKAYLADFWTAEMLRLTVSRNFPPRDDQDFLRRHFDKMAASFQPGFQVSLSRLVLSG